jgi:hypothetical protein
MFNTNNKAVDYLYRAQCQSEFDWVKTEDLACRIWEQLKNAHAGNAQIQARLFATYRREYENFTHLSSESIDAMFQQFTVIVNNMRLMWPYSRIMIMTGLSSPCTLWIIPCGVRRSRPFLRQKSIRPSQWTGCFPSSSHPRWTVGCVQRSRTRLTLILWLSCLDQGLMLTCLRDIFLCLALCPCQMRSLMC